MWLKRDLGHDDDERPALGVETNGLGKADLGLPMPSEPRSPEPWRKRMTGQVCWRFQFSRQIDDVAMEDAVDFERAIEEAGVLEVHGGMRRRTKKKARRKREEKAARTSRVEDQGIGNRVQKSRTQNAEARGAG